MSPKKTRRRAIGVELSVTCAGRQVVSLSQLVAARSFLAVRPDQSPLANQVPVEPLDISAAIAVGRSRLTKLSQQLEEVLSGGDHTAASNLFSHSRDLKAHSRFVFF